MNIVKWIRDDEISLLLEEPDVLEVLKAHAIKYYKHPRSGTRQSSQFYYIRYESDVAYSTGSYQFPENPVLEDLCCKLNELGFVFWGTFKTEIAPLDFLRPLAREGKLQSEFRYIDAGMMKSK